MIKTLYVTQLTNPVHLQFMDYVVTLVSGKNPMALHVKPQFDLLSQKLTELKNIYKSTTANPLSEQILEIDASRDRMLSGIIKIVDGYTYHYSETIETSANLVKKNIQIYGNNITKNDFQTETAKIESIINDFRIKPWLMDASVLLHLADWITELENANNEFKRLYALRTEDYSKLPDENMQSKRVEVNAAYDDLCKYLNSYSVINNTNPDYEEVISGINTYVEQYATLLKQKRSRSKAVNS
jgi:hypothetical protein